MKEKLFAIKKYETDLYVSRFIIFHVSDLFEAYARLDLDVLRDMDKIMLFASYEKALLYLDIIICHQKLTTNETRYVICQV